VTDKLRIGLDLHAGQPRIAQVSHRLGHPEIVALSSDMASLATLATEADLTFSMPDDEALVKTVRVHGQGDADVRQKVFFELSQSLLEPETNFQFDYLETGNRHQIGVIYRRERILARSKDFHLPGHTAPSAPQVDLRSIALARAYLNFCKPEPGDLIALVDISAELASVALLYHRRIVLLGNTSISARSGAEDLFRPVAVALKTLVNFKLAALRDDGITIPLAALLVTGEQVANDERATLQKFFSARVVPFTPLPNLTEQTARIGVEAPEQFLVALGLTVN
jgi:hypothetical protein